jgi:hypothetical protein
MTRAAALFRHDGDAFDAAQNACSKPTAREGVAIQALWSAPG